MESMIITKPDGQHLKALFFSPPVPFHYVIIICHGFSGRKENSGNLYAWAEQLSQQGYASLAFDFLGSGESDGTFASVTLSRQIDDLKTVMDYAYKKYQVPLLLLGRSFGGSTVIGAGNDPRVAGCILWSAAVKLEEVFQKGLGNYYNLLDKGQPIQTKIIQTDIELEPNFVHDLKMHDMDSYLKALGSKPIFAIQGLNDDLVTPENAQKIQAVCPNAEVHFIEKAGHRFENQKSLRSSLTLAWLKRHFGN